MERLTIGGRDFDRPAWVVEVRWVEPGRGETANDWSTIARFVDRGEAKSLAESGDAAAYVVLEAASWVEQMPGAIVARHYGETVAEAIQTAKVAAGFDTKEEAEDFADEWREEHDDLDVVEDSGRWWVLADDPEPTKTTEGSFSVVLGADFYRKVAVSDAYGAFGEFAKKAL